MKIKVDFRKIVTVIATFATLANSLGAPVSVLAQEITPSPTPTDTTTPTPEVTIAPADNPTATPDATPVETLAPTPEVTATPDLTTPTPTDQPVVTQAPESNPTTQGPPSVSSSVESTSVPTATPTAKPEIPQEHGTLTETVITNVDLSGVIGLNSNVDGAQVTTNQADYSPTSLVLITGTGFTANKDYTIEITSSDQPPVDFKDSIKADSSGNISYAYQLDGNYRPNYTAYIKSGSIVVATTSFTDSHEDYKHWGDKAPSPGWQNGALQSSNSQYFEGEVVPHWWTTEGLTVNSTYGFDIYYDYHWNSGNYCGFDYLAQYNTSRSPSFLGSTPTADASFSEGHGNFYTVGASILSVSSPVNNGIQRYVQVKFKATATSAEFYWGMHMALPGAISGCAGSHSWPGASLQTNVDNTPSISGASMRGGGGTLQINPSGVIQGIISGFKWNDQNNNGLYDSEPKLSGWTIQLCSDSACTSILQTATTDSSGNYKFNVTPGTYYVGEVQQSGWTKTSPSGNTLGPLVINATTPTFSSENFGNHLLPTTGTLTVHKTFTDSRTNSGITINVTGDATASGTTNSSGNAVFTLNPGTYSATATEPDGYYESGNTCSRVSVSAGSNTNCTITDSPILGTITVHKTLSGTNIGDGLNNFCFTLSPDPGNGQICADAVTGNAVFTNVPKGDYTASETQSLSAYTQTATTCDQTMSIVNNGDSKSCGVTNTRNTGTIELKKIWSGTAGQTTLNIGTSAGGTQVTSVQTGANGAAPLTTGVQTVNTGAYYVSETGGLTNYTPSLDCTDNGQAFTPGASNSFTVVKDHAYVCTFTNTRDQGTLTIAKNAIGGNGTFDFTVEGNTPSTPSINTNINSTWGPTPVDTGTYTVDEGAVPSGWNQGGYVCMKGSTDLKSNSFSIGKGENVTCTFTNTKAGAIIIKKEMVGGTDSFDFTGAPSWLDKTLSAANNWTWTFDNVTPKSGIPYKISENPKTGWDLTGLSCDDGTSSQPSVIDPTSGNTLDIYVDPGETVTCTFTNTKHATITVHKITDPADDPQSFPVSIATTSGQIIGATTGSITTSSDETFEVKAGTYNISEDLTNLPNWQLNLNGCASVTVAAGQDGVCNIYNNKLSSVSGYKYQADGTTPITNWTINLLTCTALGVGCTSYKTTTTNGTGFYSFSNLIAGFYQVAEYIDSLYTPVLGITTHDLSVSNGSTITDQNFSNFKNISVTVCKQDSFGNPLLRWQMNLITDGNSENPVIQYTGENGCTTFENLGPANDYSVAETVKDGWTNITDTIHDFGTPQDGVNPEPFTFVNQKMGHIIIKKVTEPSGSQQLFSFVLSGGTSELDQSFDLSDGGSKDSGYVLAGDGYNASETPLAGWDTQATCDNDSSIGDITVAAGETVTCTFTNTQRGSVTVTKYNDADQSGTKNGDEQTLNGWVMTLGDSTQTTKDNGSTTFGNLVPGEYPLSETPQTGWRQTDISCFNGETRVGFTEDGYYVNVTPGANIQCYVGNYQLPVPNISISKTNNAGSGINAGATVTYTLTLSTADGNVQFDNVQVTDYLPGGFTYVAGSTTGATTSDPTINGSKLTWNIGAVDPNSSVSISYQVKTDSSLTDGNYLNYAKCLGTYNEEQTKECDPANSTVTIGHGISYGGNLVGQVLGASTELPATGSPTMLLVFGFLTLGTGVALSLYNSKKGKKTCKKLNL